MKSKNPLSIEKMFVILITLFCFNIQTRAGTGDTTVVQTLRFDSTMRAGVFLFPDDSTKTYEKVTMLYSMRCKNGLISTGTDRNKGCGEWDYNCYTYVVDSSQTDSLRTIQKSHDISNSNDTIFKYTNTPVWNYIQYNQKEISISNIISEDSVSLGSGNTSLNNPFNTLNANNRSQYLWKASELSAAGLTAGNITGIKLNILSIGSPIENLRIKIKNTNQTVLNENNPETIGFTEVYFLNTTLTSSGKLQFNFNTPFNWNGTSNIIVDFSFSNPLTGINTLVKGFNDTATVILSVINGKTDESIFINDTEPFPFK